MWRSVVLASATLILGCGSHHESAPTEQTSSTGTRQLPADAGPLPNSVRAIASTADAATVATPANPLNTAAIRAAAANGTPQCSGNGPRCTLRVTAKGIYVDGDPKSREQAVAACKRTVCALVAIEDNVPPGEWKKLQAALIDAGIPILMRGVVNDTECLNNPLAKGCN